jgi:hypothetical protein
MSTVCDTLAWPTFSETSLRSRGLVCVQPWYPSTVQPRDWPDAPRRSGQQRADSPMRLERVSRFSSRILTSRLADDRASRAEMASQPRPPQPSSLTTRSTLSLSSGSVSPFRFVWRAGRAPCRSQDAVYPARQVIPNAADVAPVGVAPVG